MNEAKAFQILAKSWELRFKKLSEAWLEEVGELEANAKVAHPQTRKYYQSMAKTLYKAHREALEKILSVEWIEVKD